MDKTIKLCLLALFIITGCSKKLNNAESVANEFLEAYFQLDYEKAASMCASDISELLNNEYEKIEKLTPEIREEMKNTDVNILIMEVLEDGDDIIVSYQVGFPNQQSSDKILKIRELNEELKIISFD